MNALGLQVGQSSQSAVQGRRYPSKVTRSLWLSGRYVCALSDLAALLISLGFSYWALQHFQRLLFPVTAKLARRWEWWPLLLLVPIWLVALESLGYLRARRTTVSRMRWSICIQGSLFAALQLFLWLTAAPSISYVPAFAGVALFLPLSLLGRCLLVFVAETCHSPFAVPHLLLVGSRHSTKNMINQLRDTDCNFRIVGCLEPDSAAPLGSVEGVPILGSPAILQDFIFHNTVDVVIFTMPFDAAPGVPDLAVSVLELGICVGFPPEHPLPQCLVSPSVRVSLGLFPRVPIATLSTVSFRPAYSLLKRLLDVSVSAVALLLLWPLMLVISCLIKITSPRGPVLHRLDHVGINGRSIVGYKFRTMVPNAHSLKPQLMARNRMTGPVFKIQDDPRVTSLGRWLRRYSLDELPQLFSVLKGELSLVGPRAPMREEAERFEYWQRRKLCVKPGLTCFWQVNGRSEITDFSEWVRLDLEYIRQASFFTDIKILLRTIPVVLEGRGAY